MDISNQETKSLLSNLINTLIDLEMERNIDVLLRKLLARVRQLVGAEAGTLYLVENDCLTIKVCQNDIVDLGSIFGQNIDVKMPLNNESIAGYSALSGNPVLVADVKSIEPDKPYSFYPGMDQRSGFETRSVIAVPLKHPEEGIIGVLSLLNPLDGAFSQWNIETLKHFAVLASVSLANLKMHDALEDAYHDTILRLGLAAEFKDHDTYAHIQRIRHSAKIIARELGCEKEFQETIFHAAAMHDIGKIGVPDSILKKSGELDDEEWHQMKLHTENGAKILADSDSTILKMSADIALCHHEKWNGEGYPNGLKGADIPLAARIVAVADVFDALIHSRCYKSAWEVEDALQLIQNERDKYFDPQVVDAFLTAKEKILKVNKKFSS